MPIVFEEVSGEVVPERGGERTTPQPPPSETPPSDVAQAVRRELAIERERARRLIAD
jgi:hypothetical protein